MKNFHCSYCCAWPAAVTEKGWPAAAVGLAVFGGRAGVSAVGDRWCYKAGWDPCVECGSDRVSLTPTKTDAVKCLDT